MSVSVILAIIECDGCGKQFRVDIDGALPVPRGWSVHDMAVDAVRAGNIYRGAGGCSVEDQRLRCDECTASEDATWIVEHPTFISEVRPVAGGWHVVTYDGQKWLAAPATKPAFDKDVRDYEARPA